MLKLTVSGLEFTQESPARSATTSPRCLRLQPARRRQIAAGHVQPPLYFRVTNTTGIGRTLRLTSTAGDITFGAPTYLAAGTSALFTATLKPVAASGTVVSGAVNVLSNTSVAGGSQTLAVLPYGYTVGTTVNP